MLPRLLEHKIVSSLAAYPAVALLGPRQVGKTTLAQKISATLQKPCIYLDLESLSDLRKLDDPELYLQARQDSLIIIDEVQRKLDLFPLLRSLIDKHRVNARFLLLGSASPRLLAQSSETLAGRIAYLELHPLLWDEVKASFSIESLWLKGGYPEVLTTQDAALSLERRFNFIQTYVERELPLLGLNTNPMFTRNLLSMVAHVHGNLLNVSDLSRSLGKDASTIKNGLDYLERSFLIRRIEPYFVNISKRIVKSPKIFIRDSGILHALIGIEDTETLQGHIVKGNSWEGFVIQQVIARLSQNVFPYFYRTQDGTELDLLLVKGIKPVLGIEIKYTNAPQLGKSTTIASNDFGQLPILVVTPSIDEDYAISDAISVTSFDRIWAKLTEMKLIEP